MIGGDTGTPAWKSTGPGTPIPTPAGRSTPCSASSLRVSSIASASTASGPRRMSAPEAVARERTPSRPSVTATLIEVTPRSIPTKRRPASRSTSVDRRPPRDAAGPPSSARPSSTSRPTSAATVVRETPRRAARSIRESGPSSRTWVRMRDWAGVSARPESTCAMVRDPVTSHLRPRTFGTEAQHAVQPSRGRRSTARKGGGHPMRVRSPPPVPREDLSRGGPAHGTAAMSTNGRGFDGLSLTSATRRGKVAVTVAASLPRRGPDWGRERSQAPEVERSLSNEK